MLFKIECKRCKDKFMTDLEDQIYCYDCRRAAEDLMFELLESADIMRERGYPRMGLIGLSEEAYQEVKDGTLTPRLA